MTDPGDALKEFRTDVQQQFKEFKNEQKQEFKEFKSEVKEDIKQHVQGLEKDLQQVSADVKGMKDVFRDVAIRYLGIFVVIVLIAAAFLWTNRTAVGVG